MEMSLNKRIQKLVELKAGGNKARFAGMIDYMPQYMSRITKEGGPAGLTVVEKILQAFPDISGRWLVTGQGEMLVPDRELSELIDRTIQNLRELQSRIPIMSGQEVDALKRKLKGLDLELNIY